MWNQLTMAILNIYSLHFASVHRKLTPTFLSVLQRKNSNVAFQTFCDVVVDIGTSVPESLEVWLIWRDKWQDDRFLETPVCTYTEDGISWWLLRNIFIPWSRYTNILPVVNVHLFHFLCMYNTSSLSAAAASAAAAAADYIHKHVKSLHVFLQHLGA